MSPSGIPADDLAGDFAGLSGGALVVGGSGGIGSAVADLLRARGARVGVTYRRRPVEDGLAWQLDLDDLAGVPAVVAEAAEMLDGLHTVVHAAGPPVPMRHLSRVDPAEMAAQLQGDAAGFFAVAHAALPHLRETRGSLVAVTTAATSRFPVRDGLSAGPKGAVEALAFGLAVEEGRFGVRVNCVGPGMLTDGMAAELIAGGQLDEAALEVTRANIPLGRFGSARDVAEAVAFLVSPRATFITGQKLDVDGGYGRA